MAAPAAMYGRAIDALARLSTRLRPVLLKDICYETACMHLFLCIWDDAEVGVEKEDVDGEGEALLFAVGEAFDLCHLRVPLVADLSKLVENASPDTCVSFFLLQWKTIVFQGAP